MRAVRVMEHSDVIEHAAACVALRPMDTPFDASSLEEVEEPGCRRVVVTVAAPAHAGTPCRVWTGRSAGCRLIQENPWSEWAMTPPQGLRFCPHAAVPSCNDPVRTCSGAGFRKELPMGAVIEEEIGCRVAQRKSQFVLEIVQATQVCPMRTDVSMSHCQISRVGSTRPGTDWRLR